MVTAAAMNILAALEFGDSKPALSVLLAANIIPFAASVFVTESIVQSFGALYPIAIALPVWLTLRLRHGRASSIALAAMCSMALWFAGFVIAVTGELGAFNAETVGAVLDALFKPYGDFLSGMMYERGGEKIAYFKAADIEIMLYYFKAMYFGTVAVAMLVLAYFATLAVRIIADIFGVGHMLPAGYRISMRAKLTEKGPQVEIAQERVPWRIELDSVTVGVYIFAYAMTVLFSFSENGAVPTLYTVMMNLVIILSPGFFYCGARDIVLGFRGKSSSGRLGKIIPILVIIMTFINPMSMVFILCTLGVIVTLRENRVRRDAQINRKD